MAAINFLNWRDDDAIKTFEQLLTPEEQRKFKPYMAMFHVLKNEHKRK